MNNYQSLRKNSSSRFLSLFLIALILLELCSLALLFSRLTAYVPEETQNVFPLTESTALTTVKVGKIDADGSFHFYEQTKAFNNEFFTSQMVLNNGYEIVPLDNTSGGEGGGLTPRDPGAEFFDKDKVWAGNTDVEIFKFSYVNGENKVTVAGSGSDKLIAPGTDNRYQFTIKNTGNVSLDYKMTMDAYVEGTDLKLPVVVRVIDHDGQFCLGGEDEWAEVLSLSSVEKQGTLAADRYANFTFEWMWPFEGDDEYDTMLGNLAEDGDLSLTVIINTVATESNDPDDPGDNPPQTGDSSVTSLVVAVVAIIGAIVVVMGVKKRNGRGEVYD